MSRVRYILLVAVVALLSVACQRRPMEEEYLRVYLDLTIDRNVLNYEVGEKEPGRMRVAFFDAVTHDYLSHDMVSSEGGYIFAPYGDVDMVVYNFEAGNTFIHSQYVWSSMQAYTDEISEMQRSRFTRYLQSRVEVRPSYDDIRLTPGHLFVAREHNIHIPRHITEDMFIIRTTAKSAVESWLIDINGISGMEYISSITMMISGQAKTHFVATNTDSTEPVALYFEVVKTLRRSTTLTSRFETFGRELTSGDTALLSVLFTDKQGHSYMYNFDVSDQMENNPKQHIVIDTDINIPKPEVGGGFKPELEDWNEHRYDIEI